MKSATCSAVQAAAGFSPPARVMPVKVKPGIRIWALMRSLVLSRSVCARPSGERLHRRLADVVSGVAWRLRNPLLGPGVDHDPGPPAVDHRWDEGMDTVEHAHQ